MDLNALKFFCDVVETESLTRAAERCRVSQSAISQRIRRLEDSYGQILLERGKGKGRATVTDAGRQLYVGAKQILLDAGALDTHMMGLNHGPSGTVAVATVYSVGLHLLPSRLKPFLAANPRIKVHVEYSQTGKVYQDILSSNVDVGIVACPAERPGILMVPFVDEVMAVIVPLGNSLARKTQISLSDLAGQPFVAFSPPRQTAVARSREGTDLPSFPQES